jgi:hypothetical protein
MGRTQQAKTKYMPYDDMRNCTFLVMNYLLERGGLPLSEISRITSLDPDEIATRNPGGLYIDDRTPIPAKRGRKPINPEGAMTGAERFRKGWRRDRIEGSQVEYDEFADALRLYDKGLDVKGSVDKKNHYLMALYKIAVEPRSIKSLEREGVEARRLAALTRGNYRILERLDDRSATYYKPTEKGRGFLYALMPAMRQAIEGKIGEELVENL